MVKRKRFGSRKARRGVEIIEFTLVLLPMLGFIYLLLDLSWAVYRRATLQYAVREGCRYAVTNQVVNLNDANGKAYGMVESVKYVVQQRAMGFLGRNATAPGYSAIQVRFYDPTASLTSALAVGTNCANIPAKAPNTGGNLVEVSIENYQANSMAPLLRSAAPLNFTARSSDRMEGNPSAGVPNTYNGTCP
jgi:Flp pilus assembly protein TadG